MVWSRTSAHCELTMKDGATRSILVGDIPIALTRKRIKHTHLRVHPPDGRVTISAPHSVRLQVLEAFATTRLEWIKRQQDRVRGQARDVGSRFITGESHYLWGHSYLLSVVEPNDKQGVAFDDRQITLFIQSGSDVARRAHVMHAWHKSILHETLPPLIRHWEQRLDVHVKRCSLRLMKTRWGSCNSRTRHIRLSTELVTKPGHLLEYVLVHEMVHLLVPNHGARFVALMSEHYPHWREARSELNESHRRNRERARNGQGSGAC
jgi:predicted metal-dependent hydrolase